MQSPTVAVVGGGAMGASVLYHLIERGCKNAILFERGQVGSGATGRALGGVRNLFSHPLNVSMMMDNIAFFECFEEQVGHSVDFNQAGYLFLFRDADVESIWQNRFDLYQEHGIDIELLAPTEVPQYFDGVDTDAIRGALLGRDCGFVDPHEVTQALVRSATNRGATVYTNTTVTDVVTRGGGVAAIETDEGRVEVDQVVDAAGPLAGRVANMVGLDLPLKFVRSGYLVTDELGPRNTPLTIDERIGARVRAERNGKVLVGIPKLELNNLANVPQLAQDEQIEALEGAAKVLPEIAEQPVTNYWTGTLTLTPDGHPILGSTNIDGFFLACGFSGHGLMMVPEIGAAVVEQILTGATDRFNIDRLSLARFDAPVTERIVSERKSTSTATE